MLPTAHAETTARPLSSKSKIGLVKKLALLIADAHDCLKEPLIEAALQLKSFPPPLNDKMGVLQTALREHQKNPQVRQALELAIKSYIETEGHQAFKDLISQPCVVENWNSDFLGVFVQKLQIEIDDEPLVKAVIFRGKVYWQVQCGEKILYSKPMPEDEGDRPDFSRAWLMTWEDFRLFKDSGKRSSTVEITKERFVTQLSGTGVTNASNIWDELKERGVLNRCNRLSDGWRAFTGDYITLKALGTSRSRVNYYQKISDALNAIATNPDFRNQVSESPDITFFRPERNKKTWASNGAIKNTTPRSLDLCTRLWDVNIKARSSGHRKTDFEQATYGTKLEYDHIPSSAQLTAKRDRLRSDFQIKIERAQAEIKRIEDEIYLQQQALLQAQARSVTRQQVDTQTNSAIEGLKERREQLKLDLRRYKNDSKVFSAENGSSWWTIALPASMHKQGETYSVPAAEQSKNKPMLDEFRKYLDMLAARPEEFSLEAIDYLKALGAFRYLYRQQIKTGTPINGKFTTPFVARALLAADEDKSAIDDLLNTRIRIFMQGSLSLASDMRKEDLTPLLASGNESLFVSHKVQLISELRQTIASLGKEPCEIDEQDRVKLLFLDESLFDQVQRQLQECNIPCSVMPTETGPSAAADSVQYVLVLDAQSYDAVLGRGSYAALEPTVDVVGVIPATRASYPSS